MSNTFEQKGKTFVIGLIIWNIVLTLALALGALVVLGKFSRLERDKAALVHDVNAELEAGKKWMDLLSGRIDKLLEIQQNLFTKVKTLEENPSEVSEQISQLETRIGVLQETQNSLRQDVDLLFKADKEHPVLVPANKGGRPRKEPV